MNRPEAQEKTSVTCTDAAHTMPVNSLTLPETTSGTHPTFQLGLVSVMMPAFNAERFIAEAIESVLNQVYPNWELIIVNDGSTDRTAEIVSRFSDSRIVVIHQPNGGEAAARNTALKQAKGEYLAFLDADDIYLPNHLRVTMGYLQAHPEYHGVYTDGYYCDSHGNRIQSLSSRRRGPYEGLIFEEVVRSSDVFGPPLSVVLRREPIVRNQLTYDINIVIGPDWDFFVRYAERTLFGYIKDFTCLYRIHQSNISTQINVDRRALELAKCRMKAIKLAGFNDCSVGTRTAVFYDLLVNLLRNYPEKQSEIVDWPEFIFLPTEKQSLLLRMMASKAVVQGVYHMYIEAWFRRSRELHPGDLRGLVVSGLYRFSPFFCHLVLRVRVARQGDTYYVPHFADLQYGKSL